MISSSARVVCPNLTKLALNTLLFLLCCQPLKDKEYELVLNVSKLLKWEMVFLLLKRDSGFNIVPSQLLHSGNM